MTKMFIGSETLGGWFDDDNSDNWTISQIIDDLKQSVCDNSMMQAVCGTSELDTLRSINDATVWALRELSALRDEFLNSLVEEEMKGVLK